jgi:molecular chaperone HscB
MWRRGAGLLRPHLAAASVGRRVRRPPAPLVPAVPSSTASSSCRQILGIFRCSIGAPSRCLSNQAGGGGGACWSCSATGAFLSCGSCGSVQPVDPAVDYFQIFGL